MFRKGLFMKNLSVVVVAIVAAVVASAKDYNWAAAQDGTFGTSANWSPNTGVPGEDDNAVFDVPGTYCVSEVEASRTIGSVSVTNANVIMALGGNTWTIKGPWATYNQASDAAITSTTITNGTLDVQHGSSSGASGIIISAKDSSVTKGNLRITGDNTHVTTKALWMGGTRGSFILDGGATCDVAGEVRWGAEYGGGSDNLVVITGEGTRFRQTAAGATTGNNIGDRCKYYISDGASAYFTSTYHLAGGYGGRWNELWITNGASVVYGGGFAVGSAANGRPIHQNVCTIAGMGTCVTVTGRLDVATAAISNLLHITDHAVVTQTVATGTTLSYVGYDGANAGQGCGHEFRVDGGAEYRCVPSPSASYHYLYVGGGVYSTGNRIFVGEGSLFEIARVNNNGMIGYNGAYNNGIVVSNGTFNISTSWPISFGTSKNESTPCGSGNYVEFYGDHPLAYMGQLTFNTGSKLIYHIGANGYAAAPMNFRYKAQNTSLTPARLVLDVSEWRPDRKTTIPLVQTMQDGDVTANKVLLDELKDNVSVTGTKHPEWYTVSLSADNKTLQLTCKPIRELILMIL